jgi:2'-5' RNA ligase
MRLFIGIKLDPVISRRIEALQAGLRVGGGDVKWVAPANLHLTLHFLGETSSAALGVIQEAMDRGVGAFQPFVMRLQGIGAFPYLNRPRVVWVGVTSAVPTLKVLHRALGEHLVLPGFIPEPKFTPHITLGRVRSQKNLGALIPMLTKYADIDAGEQKVTEIVLVASQLTRSGPIYQVVSRAPLGVRSC